MMFSAKGKMKSGDLSRLSDHMANERTFLAWIRTSIGIMAFGFVLEKFTLFLRQTEYVLNQQHLPGFHNQHSFQAYSSVFGVVLIVLGALLCLLAFIKYKTVESQIENNTYYPTILLDIMLMLAVVLIGVFLALALSI
jgi:putative membrane protein